MSDVKPLFDELNSNLELLLDKFKIEIGKANNGEDNSVNKYQNFVKRLFKVCYEFASEFDEEEENVYFLRQKLKESEDRYNLIMENASDVIAVFNDKLFVEAINEIALYRLSGYHREEIIGKSAFNFIHKDDFVIASTKLKEVLEKGTGKMEARFHHKDGHYFWVEASGKTFVDNNGETKGLAILRDISDHKKAEQMVEQKLLCQEVITKISNLFINISDLDYSINKSLEYIGQISEASRSYLFLVSEDQTSFSNTYEWCNKGVNSKKEEIQNIPLKVFPWIIRKLKNEGYVHTEDISNLPLEAKAEKEIYLRENVASLLCYPISIDNKFKGILGIENYESIKEWNDEIFTFLKVTSDIISRALMHQYVEAELIYSKNQLTLLNKNLEQKVEERTKQLKQSESKYRLITENANDLIVIINENFEYEYINEQVHRRIRGISEIDRIGKSVLSIIHPEDIETIVKALKEGFIKGEGKIEVRLINADKTYDWFEVRGKTFKDYDGKKKAILITRNINERKLSEQALIKSEKKYRNIFESIADPIHVIDADFKIRYINPAFERWLKSLNLDLNVIGKTPVEAWPFIGENVKDEYQKVFKTKQIDIKEEMAHINNIATYTEARKIPIVKSGNVVQVITIIRDITDRKNAELKLKSEKEKAQKYLDIAGVVILALDIEGNITVLNKQGYKLLQYEEGELIGKNWFETCISIDNRKQVYDVFESLMRNELELVEFHENSILTKSGEEKIIAWKNSFIHDKYGKIIGTLSSGEDITERKKAELKLKESEEKYRHLFENSPHYIMLLDKEGNFIYCNNSTIDLFGYSKEDFLGKNFREMPIIPPETLPIIENKMELLFKGEMGPPLEFKLVRKDGKSIWINSQASLIKLENESFIYIFGQDITEKKEVERKLRESEEKYRSFVENFQGIAFQGYADYSADFFHGAVEEITGYTAEDFTSGRIKLNQLFFPEDDSKLQEQELEFEKSLDYQSEYRIKAKDGTPHWILSKSQKFYDEKRKQEGARGILIDITDKKKAEEQLKESEEKFRKIADQNLMGIAIIQDNVYKYINGAYVRATGYSKEEMLNWKPNEYQKLVHPDFLPLVKELEKKKRQGEVDVLTNYYYKGIRKDGQEIWNELYVRPISYNGRPADLHTRIDRTNQRYAEEALKESEKKYRHLFESSPYIIGLIDENGILVDCNSSINKLLSMRSREDVKGKKILDLLSIVEENKELMQLMKKVFQEPSTKGQRKSHEFKMHRSVGGFLWLEAEGSTIEINNQKLFQFIVQDITNRKIIEENLKESEEKFRTIAEQSLMGIGILQDEELKYLNKKFANIYGYSVEEFSGMTFSEFLNRIHPEDRAKLIKKVEKRKDRTRDTITFYQFRSFKKTGELFWVNIYSRIISYQGKRASLFTILDITEMKTAELKLKESEVKFRNIAEQSFMGIIIRQHDSVKYVNDAALNIFGYSMEETLEWTTEYINEKFIHMEDLPYFMKNRRTERDADSEKKHYLSYRIITKSGNIRWIDQYSKIFLYQGKISELITIVDITEKKEAEKLIIEENKKLLELDKIRRDFLIRASHELKTPLNSVYSTSEFLLHYNEEILDEKLKKFLEIIYKGGKRLKLLIENLLDVSRIESDKIELNLTEKNIRKIIKNCIKEVDYLSKKRNISIIFEKSEDILINLDKIRMEQVFVNILVNAIKNTPVFGEVTINTLQEKDQLKIIFNDTGVGFTEEEKEKTFKKFGKIERYGQGMDIDTEGSGLGLFISKEIVELHGGKIELLSRGRYKGSKIIIQLPL